MLPSNEGMVALPFRMMMTQQLYQDERSLYRKLACLRVNGTHTENIKTWFKEIVTEFEVDEKQLLVFAIDSAANIQKASRDYLSDMEEKFAVEEIPEDLNVKNIDLTGRLSQF